MSDLWVIVEVVNEVAGHGDNRDITKLATVTEGGGFHPAFETEEAARAYIDGLKFKYGLDTCQLAMDSPPFTEALRPQSEEDLFVSIGSLGGTRLEGVKNDLNQEDMVEDYIDSFNGMVVQGMPPVKALFAFAQAFGLTLGYCLRCGLQPSDGRKLLGMLIEESKKNASAVQIVTTGQKLQ